MVYRPTVESCPLSTALAWRGDGEYLYQEKLDGQWHEMRIGHSVVVGELMKSGEFYAFDVPMLDGQDIRLAPLRDRFACLDRFSFKRPARGSGGEFLEHVLARGGEGVVAKPWAAGFGQGWLKAKRSQVFYVVVTGKASDGRQSVAIAHLPGPFQDMKNLPVSRREKLEPAGNLALRGDKFDRVRIGSILKVEAFCKNANGILREPRLDRDCPESWLAHW